MPPTRARIVRKASLASRLKAYLDPLDLLLWLSEELNSNELEDALKQWATPLAIACNFLFMIARANTGHGTYNRENAVFGDYEARRGSGWLGWVVSDDTDTDLLRISLGCAVADMRRVREAS